MVASTGGPCRPVEQKKGNVRSKVASQAVEVNVIQAGGTGLFIQVLQKSCRITASTPKSSTHWDIFLQRDGDVRVKTCCASKALVAFEKNILLRSNCLFGAEQLDTCARCAASDGDYVVWRRQGQKKGCQVMVTIVSSAEDPEKNIDFATSNQCCQWIIQIIRAHELTHGS
nr:hypothetical protein [Desulfonatronum thioautotrophicum]